MNAIAYIRLSTKGQEDGYGIDTQKNEINAWAFAHNCTITDYVVETGSGAKERPLLEDLIYKGEEDIVVLVLPYVKSAREGVKRLGKNIINSSTINTITIPSTLTSADYAFFGCNNLHGTPDFCEGVVNVQRCYANCTNLTGPPKLPPNPCYQFHSIFYSAGTYFNYGLYSNCENLRGKPVTGDFIDNCMAYMYYNCYNLSGPPVCHKNVTDARYVYAGCINMTGSPVVGNNVETMSGMYMGCENITGRPACPDSVKSAQNAYRECRKLTGAVNLGANLTDMSNMYYGCDNLTGSPKCTENIVDMSYAFGYCRKLTGTPVFNKNVAYCRGAYIGCDNLTGGYVYPNTDHSISDISYLYAVCNKLHGGLENFVDKKFSHADYAFSGDKVDIPSTWTHTLTNARGMFSGARSSSNAPISITISWNMQYLNFADSMLYVDNGIVGGHLYLNSATTYYIDNPSHYFDSHGNRRCLFSSIRPYSNEKVTQPPFYFHIRRGTYFENYFRNFFYQFNIKTFKFICIVMNFRKCLSDF